LEEELLEVAMKKMIKIEIYHDGEFYCARCIDDLDISAREQRLMKWLKI